jgi:hypothetical protein
VDPMQFSTFPCFHSLKKPLGAPENKIKSRERVAASASPQPSVGPAGGGEPSSRFASLENHCPPALITVYKFHVLVYFDSASFV